MCDCRDECYVVPKRPSGAMGWWFGQVIGETGKFLHICVVRSQFSSISGTTIISALKNEVDIFEDPSQAFSIFRERKGIPFDAFV